MIPPPPSLFPWLPIPSVLHYMNSSVAAAGINGNKAELLLLKLIHLFAREVLLVKKLEIEETKTT